MWVADVPAALISCGGTLAQPFPQSSVAGCRDRYQVADRGDASLLSGFPLRVGMTFVRPGAGRDLSRERALAEGAAPKNTPPADLLSEVKEISTQPLDAALFEIPPNFKQAKSEMEIAACAAVPRP